MWVPSSKFFYRIVLAYLAFLWTACSDPPSEASSSQPSNFKVTAFHSDTLLVGDPLTIRFEISPEPEGPGLSLASVWGATYLFIEKDAKGFSAELPVSMSRCSGPLDWVLYSGTQAIGRGTLHIQPLGSRPPQLESYAGPSHLRAGGNQAASFVTLPVDALDNPLPDSTAVVFQWGKDGSSNASTVYSRNMLAIREIPAGVQTGVFRLSAALGGSVSKVRSLQVQAGVPEDFNLVLDRPHRVADGSSLLRVLAGPIRDAYGNTVTDGTTVVFRKWDGEGRQTVVQAHSLGGFAEVSLPFPDRAGTWLIQAGVLGYGSSPRESIRFEAGVIEAPLRIAEGGRRWEIGPVSLVQGGLVPDGFPCRVRVYAGDQTLIAEKRLRLRDGRLDFELNTLEFPNSEYRVEVSCGDFEWVQTINLQSGGRE